MKVWLHTGSTFKKGNCKRFEVEGGDDEEGKGEHVEDEPEEDMTLDVVYT